MTVELAIRGQFASQGCGHLYVLVDGMEHRVGFYINDSEYEPDGEDGWAWSGAVFERGAELLIEVHLLRWNPKGIVGTVPRQQELRETRYLVSADRGHTWTQIAESPDLTGARKLHGIDRLTGRGLAR